MTATLWAWRGVPMTNTFRARPPSTTRAVQTTARAIFFTVPFFTRRRKSTSFAASAVSSAPVGAAMSSFRSRHSGQVSKCRSTASFDSSPRRFST